MTVAFPFSTSCHGEYGCFIHGLLLCLGGYFRSSKGDGLGIMHDLGGTIRRGLFSKQRSLRGNFTFGYLSVCCLGSMSFSLGTVCIIFLNESQTSPPYINHPDPLWLSFEVVQLSMTINYLMLPINSLKCTEEETEYDLSKLQGFLEKRFLCLVTVVLL